MDGAFWDERHDLVLKLDMDIRNMATLLGAAGVDTHGRRDMDQVRGILNVRERDFLFGEGVSGTRGLLTLGVVVILADTLVEGRHTVYDFMLVCERNSFDNGSLLR